jgi:hypothetical protein
MIREPTPSVPPPPPLGLLRADGPLADWTGHVAAPTRGGGDGGVHLVGRRADAAGGAPR